MFHQQGSAAGSRLQGSHLLVQQFTLGTACLPGGQGVVYLAACIQQCLLEGKGGLFLPGTGYAVLRNDLPAGKERLRQRTYRRSHELAGIHNHRTGGVGPARTSAQRDGRIESGTRRIGSVERRFQCPLGRTDIGTAGKHPDRNPYGKVCGELLLGQHTAFITAGCLCQQQSKAVLHLVYLLFQIEYGSLHLIVGSLHLRNCRLISHARIHQRTGRSNGFLPSLFRLPGDGKLFVQHQQGIVGIGYPGNELGAHRLAIVPALRIERLRLFLGIAHTAENIQFPTGSDGQRIGLRSLVAVKAAHRALRCKSKGGQESKLCGQQGGFGFLHAELCRLVVGIVL